MFKKRCLAVVISVTMLLSGISAGFAEGAEQPIEVDNEARTVTFSIDTIQYEGTGVAISVWKPDCSRADMAKVYSGEKALSDISVYIAEVTVNSQKKIEGSFTLGPDEDSGIYTMDFHVPGNSEPVSETFSYSNVARARSVLLSAQSGDASAFKIALDGGIKDVSMEAAEKYLTYNDTVKQYISKNVVENPPADIPELENQLLAENNKIETVKKFFVLGEDRGELKEFVETNYEVLMLDSGEENCWTKYNGLSKDKKEKLYVYLAENNSDCIFPEDVKAVFESALDYATKPSNSGNNGGGSGGGSSSGSSSKGSSSKGNSFSISTPDATYKPEENAVLQPAFSDIKDHWAQGYIELFTSKKIVNGKSETEFCPDDNITREEFLKIMIGALDIKSASVAAVPFKDIEIGAWYYEPIVTAYTLSITKGISSDSFGIGQNITRQDMALFLYNGLVQLGKNFDEKNMDFTDTDEISSYAATSVAQLAGAEVISGYEDGSFRPNANATRAEAVAMLYKVMDKFKLM